jgi:TRAP-type C4-dicarboxylate transport system substrate-binding protein
MKTIALSLAILAATAALSAQAGADFEIQMQLSEANNAHNSAEIKKAFKLAAAERGRQAIEISCSPASSSWCAKDFVTACDNAKGGMSTDPDGGVTCSLPQYK